MAHSILARIKDLRARSAVTDALPHRQRSEQLASALLERREALRMLEEAAIAIETAKKEFIALESRVYTLCTLATRTASGHTWLSDLPQKANGSAFYQELHALARHLRERSREAQASTIALHRSE